jgi:DHA1 family bicyclomycin/chloramphenicol resistance-like MFS transporter
MGGQANRYFLRKHSPLRISYVAAYFTLTLSVVFFVLVLSMHLPLAAVSSILVLILFTTGFVSPNTTALSLDNVKKNIGLASALNGSIRMILGACVSVLIGMVNSKTMLPMALSFVALSALALLFINFGDRVQQATKA